MKVRNPRTGEYDYEIVCATPDTIAAEAKRLRAAQPAWRALGAAGRADILTRWANAIDAAAPALVETLSVDTGRVGIARSR